MNKSLLRLLILTIKASSYGLMIQVLFLSVLHASTGTAQYKRANEIIIKEEINSLTVRKIFDLIESNSDLEMYYMEKDLEENVRINLTPSKNRTVYDILMEVSKQAGLKFRQVNNGISTTPILNQDIKNNVSRIEIIENVTVTGNVTDETGMGLPGVTVLEYNTGNGSITDINGDFSLTVSSKEATVIISFIGYVTQRIVVGDRSTIDFQMELDMQQLDEIVVVGYGVKQKANLVGAVDQINSSFIEDRPVKTAMQALQGAAPNLIIQQRSFSPTNNDMNINIRGVSTLNNNNPLIVIDGVTTDFQTFNKISPDDIEGVSILKDAGSAAIYGSRSANGVILITTKKGTLNSAPKVRLSMQAGMQVPEILFRPVKGYENAILKNQALVNGGNLPLYDPETIRDLRDNGDAEWFADEILKNAHQTNLNASIAGGNQNTTYRVSAGYFNQGSNFVGNNYGYKRYNFRTNLINTFGKFKLSTLVSFTHVDQEEPNQPEGVLLVDATRIPKYYYYRQKADNGKYLINDVLSQFNSLAFLEKGGTNTHDNENVLLNLSGEYEIFQGLKLRGLFGTDMTLDHRFQRNLEIPFYRDEADTEPATYANQTTQVADYNGKILNINAQLLLDYNRTFDKHTVNGLFGAANEAYSEKFNEIKKNFTDPDLGTPISDTEITLDSRTSNQATIERSINSLLGRLGYSYDGKYFIEGTFRYDGSSKFAEENRWGFFPSATLGWRISDESFMQSYRENVGDIKIRGSYGILGNQAVNEYSYYTTYETENNQYGFNNELVSGSKFVFGNRQLQWEKSTNFNIGIDLSLLKNRLDFSFDVFDKNTSGILLTPVVASTFGGSVSKENAGEIRNRGWEASINFRTATGDFKHNFNFNIADTQNEVIDYGGEERIDGGDGMLRLTREGESIGSYYGYVSDGFFQSQGEIESSALPLNFQPVPGDVKYKDINDDGDITDLDRVIIGNPFPRYTFGLNYTIRWKNFDMALLVQGVGKRDQFIRGELLEPFHENYSQVIYQHQLDYWTPFNTDAKYPRLSSPGSASNQNSYNVGSDLHILNAAYIRLKDVQIGYNLSNNVCERLGIQKMRLSVNAQNLLTLAETSWLDPESTEFGNDLGGVDGVSGNSARSYPRLEYYGMTLNVEF